MLEQYDRIREKDVAINHEYIGYWLDHCFLTPRWWFLVALFMLPWVIFFRLTKREELPRLLFLGLIWILVAANLDGIGFDLGLWGYPGQLIPILSKAYVFDYALIPVTYMLLYKYFPKGKSFLYGNIVLSAGASFIAEPVFEWLHIYHIYHWKLWWSFVIYIVLSYLIRWVVELVFRREG
ncbi:CBO0543 family protein [Rossellomorea aquimaris]|nr:CBO0543 family protein [Rossellomorea aquimaris]WRP07252.1 CBO0543 family protein [Rossellomorea aquimaris]